MEYSDQRQCHARNLKRSPSLRLMKFEARLQRVAFVTVSLIQDQDVVSVWTLDIVLINIYIGYGLRGSQGRAVLWNHLVSFMRNENLVSNHGIKYIDEFCQGNVARWSFDMNKGVPERLYVWKMQVDLRFLLTSCTHSKRHCNEPYN